MENQEKIPPSTEETTVEEEVVETDVDEEVETVDEGADETPDQPIYDPEKSLDEQLEEYFANLDEEDDEEEQEEQEEEEEADAEEGDTPSVEPTPQEASPQKAELDMLRKLFADGDELAKESLFGNLIEMIADHKGIPVEEYKESLGISDPPKQEEPKQASTQETISQLLSMKVKADVEAIKRKFPDAKITSIADIKNSSEYVALRDKGVSPEDAYAQVMKPKADGKKHMTPTASKTKPTRATQMTAYEKKVARDLFGDKMSDAEIQKLYHRVNH